MDSPDVPAASRTVELAVDGMTCAACATRIEKALNRLPGTEATINLATERARVRFAPGRADVAGLIEIIRKAGYDARELAGSTRAGEASRHAEIYRGELRLFWIALTLTSPLLLQMGAMFTGEHAEVLPRWLQWLLATPVQFWIGRRFYVGAWHALRGGSANMDVLIALGTSMAYLFSAAVTAFGLHGQHVYFEASAAIITLVLTGKLLEARARGRTSAAIEQLLQLQPRRARVERNGEVLEVDLAAVVCGDIVIVRPGERVAVDGDVLADGGTALGYIAIADQPRPTSAAASSRLKAMGVEVVMLTGDNAATARAMAAKLGISEFRAEVLPADKAAEVSRLKGAGGLVAMAGDGVNDAPALAAADVSFAIASGSDIAIEAADVTLMRSDLMSVVDAIRLSRATLSKIRQNLFFAFFYNVLGIPLAALGMLNPVIAGASMALSSVSVVTNSLLLKRWKPQQP